MLQLSQIGIVAIIWWILIIIGDWKLFTKAGIPGWHSIIPILNIYDEYKLCWTGGRGILFLIALTAVNTISKEQIQGSVGYAAAATIFSVLVIYLHIVESHKLSKAFGKGMLFTIFLIIFDRLGRMVLGFGSAQYVRRRRS